jgi:hypothetical protein
MCLPVCWRDYRIFMNNFVALSYMVHFGACDDFLMKSKCKLVDLRLEL